SHARAWERGKLPPLVPVIVGWMAVFVGQSTQSVTNQVFRRGACRSSIEIADEKRNRCDLGGRTMAAAVETRNRPALGSRVRPRSARSTASRPNRTTEIDA